MGWFSEFGEAVVDLLEKCVLSLKANPVGWLVSVGSAFVFGLFVGGVIFG